jgi:NarL family two-component system response regulator LiaR
MSRAIPQTSISVCSVTENCLIAAYLGQLLSADQRLNPLSWERFNRLSSTCRRDTVFLIDQCGSATPLCECLKKLRGDCPNAKFLVLDHQKSNEEILRLLILGAHGYVANANVSNALTRAILCVAAGQLWVPQEVLQEFLCEAGRILRKDARHRQTTTPREDEILELVRRRLSNREIADLLEIRVSTVKFHVSNIFSKMHASSRRELADVPFRKLETILTH